MANVACVRSHYNINIRKSRSIMSIFGPPDIARLKEKGKVKELIKALDYAKDNQIRINAVNALSDLKCEEAVEPICRILNELSGLDIDLSLSCALALGKIGDAKALKPLTEALNRTGNDPKLEEVLKLKRQSNLFSRGFDFTLAGKLAADWISSRNIYMNSVRIAAAKALGKTGCKEAIPVLINTLMDKNPVVSRSASDGLASLGYEAIVELIPFLDKNADYKVRQLAFRAISQIKIKDAEFLLQSFSPDKDEIVQGYIESASSITAGWKPPQVELVNELLELLNFYTEINLYEVLVSIRPDEPIDQKVISENAVKESVDVLTQKYIFNSQDDLDEILKKVIDLQA